MSQKNALRVKQLKAAVKRRAKRPVAQITPVSALQAKGNVERRMIRDHADVLQNIEFTVAKAGREFGDLDDHIVEQVLRTAITRHESTNARVMEVKARLEAIRDFRGDVAEEMWINGLQTIYSSLRRHSACRPGDTEYLDFIDAFIR